MNGSGAVYNAASLASKLAASQARIYGVLDNGIPKAQLVLPTLNMDSFGGMNKRASEGYHLVGATSLSESGRTSISQLELKATEARRRLEEAAAELEVEAIQRIEASKKGLAVQVCAPLLAAVLSLAIAFGMAWLRFGSSLSSVIGATINVWGLFASWKSRSDSHFQLVNGIVERAKMKVHDSLETLDYALLGPLEELTQAIDIMAKEQKPTVDRAKAMGRDVANPVVLKEPLVGCDAELADAVLAAKWEVSKRMEKILNSSFVIRLPTSKGLWDFWQVTLPCDMLLILNCVVGLTQAWLAEVPPKSFDYDERAKRVAAEHAAKAAAKKAAEAATVARLLKGGHGRQHGFGPGEGEEGPRMFHGVPLLDAPTVYTGAGTMPEMAVLLSYMLPVFFSVVMCLIELFIMSCLSRRSKILSMANAGILALQDRITKVVAEVVGPAADRVQVQLGLVRGKADSLFAKLKAS